MSSVVTFWLKLWKSSNVLENDTEKDEDAGKRNVLESEFTQFYEAFVYIKHFQHTDTIFDKHI